MSKDIETLKERIIALVDGRNLPYVISLLNGLENAIHEHSFDSGDGDSFDDVLEIPLIGERKTTSGLENCSIWWG